MDLIERAAERLKKSEGADAEAKAPAKAPVKAAAKKKPSRIKATAPSRKAPPALVQTGRQSRRVEVDLDHLRRNGFLVPDDPPTRLAEEFRVIKRQLLRRALPGGPDKIDNGNMLLVTSTQPAEGKTFCAINLALSIASERDLTVLLVDADVARPQLMEALHVDADKGLIDVIVDERVSFSDCMLRTNIDNLSLLPAGRPHPAATELLSSEKMGEMVEELARRYSDRIIIFDSSPVLASSAPGVLAQHVGQTMFVVEADRTRETQVIEALSLISECKNINLLLNKTRFMGGKVRFGSYYEYYRT